MAQTVRIRFETEYIFTEKETPLTDEEKNALLTLIKERRQEREERGWAGRRGQGGMGQRQREGIIFERNEILKELGPCNINNAIDPILV